MSRIRSRVIAAAAVVAAIGAVSCNQREDTFEKVAEQLSAIPPEEISEPVTKAPELVDIGAYFDKAAAERGAGLASKTRAVSARLAVPGEVIETWIEGEEMETKSPPANEGDMVVMNMCEETGNEMFLVPGDGFSKKYEGPTGASTLAGWELYTPTGRVMRFVNVVEADGEFSFMAPWGEAMIAKPGDVIVQDLENAADTYRIERRAFACTYEVLEPPTVSPTPE